jgi:glutamine synthetase
MNKNIYELPPEELKNIPSTCKNLEEAYAEFEKDHEWLTAGDVFDPDMIEAYAAYKKSAEIEPMKLRPNPFEFELYYHG